MIHIAYNISFSIYESASNEVQNLHFLFHVYRTIPWYIILG